MNFFILTIILRKKKVCDDKERNINYYCDLSDIQRENVNNKVKRDEVFNDEFKKEVNEGITLTNQIFINAEICRRKHDALFNGIIALIPFALSMIELIVLFVIG